VAPALLGRAAMWWDLLADSDRGLPPGVRTHALGALRGEHDRIVAWAERVGLPRRAPSERLRIASLEELRAVATRPEVSIGLHTWSHPNLAALDANETSEEIERCRRWLMEHVGQVRPWLAYPYGLHTDLTTLAARDAGLAMALRVDGGMLRGLPESPFRIPRLNVPSGLSDRGFTLRTSGVTWR
jgi:peptidoglycan/xylan/chitin deacetylase (PgdA/CDA1 family)